MSNTLRMTAQLSYDPALPPTPRTMKIVKDLAIGSGQALSLIGGTWPIPVGFSGSILLPFLNERIAGFVIRNDTNQPLGVELNGDGPQFNLQPGAEMFEISPTAPTVQLQDILLDTTVEQDGGPNQIRFFIVERA
jgi:hypothetical protein